MRSGFDVDNLNKNISISIKKLNQTIFPIILTNSNVNFSKWETKINDLIGSFINHALFLEQDKYEITDFEKQFDQDTIENFNQIIADREADGWIYIGIEDCKMIIEEKGPRRISPFFVPGSIINMIAGNLSIMYGLRGPNIAVTTACTTATHNIGLAARMIQCGDADIMLAGGAEKATTPVGLGGFCAARALSKRNDDPQAASRPWDKDRDGFVLGDGAGVMVLEEYESAKARGAKIYAELTGFGMSGDAYHMTLPSGKGAQRAMEKAMADAGLKPSEIQYINAHGTSTKAGDVGESQAIEAVLGDAAKNVAVSSSKSMTGHALGAAGALEAIFTVMAIKDQIAPPTINLNEPDEGCNLNYVPNKAQPMAIQNAFSNSFGFGGTNGTILFSKVD